MSFHSILFQRAADRAHEKDAAEPDYFSDLNLNQVVASITDDKEGYNLVPFFYAPLHDADDVTYRHEVMRDLEDPELMAGLKNFAASMLTVREYLAETEKRYYQHQIERWFLDAVAVYIDAVAQLHQALSTCKSSSRGLNSFRQYVSTYVISQPFAALVEQTQQLKNAVSEIRYEVLIEGSRVEVRKYKDEPNYSTEIKAVFERFSQGATREYTYGFKDSADISQVEGRILDLVGQAYSVTFSGLTAFYANNRGFLDPTLVAFDREVQFYIAYLEYIATFQDSGLHFCFPHVSSTSKDIFAGETFDLALAEKLACDHTVPVTNDFYLENPERMMVVSGPNQGGKTTFARTFGQLHYLASLGLPVPGVKAQLYLPDTIFTHFERQEQMANLRGKLQDDLVRMHAILKVVTPKSLIIVNEIFTSTTFQDALGLSEKIAGTILKLDALCIWITFIDEIASLSEKTVSMTSTIVPNKPAVRTFKVVRRPADGLAYAISIAEKYKLTYDMIVRRIKS